MCAGLHGGLHQAIFHYNDSDGHAMSRPGASKSSVEHEPLRPTAAAAKAREPMNVLIVGVGGQGVIMVSKALASLAQSQGFEVKQSEVHGMAKRGGTVFSHVRFGPQVWSPTIPKGKPTSWSRSSGPKACAGCRISSRTRAFSSATPSASCRPSPVLTGARRAAALLARNAG